MTFDLQVLAVVIFAAAMAIAAFEDFRRLVIPNLLPIALCLTWPLYFATHGPTLAGGVGAVGCALAAFFAGAVLFARGWLGGGDVKLLAAATLWAGPSGTPALLMLTGVLGGVLALFLLLPFGSQLATAGRIMLGQTSPTTERGFGMPVPYGIAIAGAGLIVVLSPYLG